MNPNQKKAVDLHYQPLLESFGLPYPTVPAFNESKIAATSARERVLHELRESGASTLVLLGDLPIRHFLDHYCTGCPSRLSDFGTTTDTYGKPHQLSLSGMILDVIPLCHPRQAGRLGMSSSTWGTLHADWVRRAMGKRESFLFDLYLSCRNVY